MGLSLHVEKPTIIHQGPDISYSGFGAFRDEIARMIGEEEWRRTLKQPDCPFKELLLHSDCEGELSQEECAELARDFVAWEQPSRSALSYYNRIYYDQVLEMLKACAMEDGAKVVFS